MGRKMDWDLAARRTKAGRTETDSTHQSKKLEFRADRYLAKVDENQAKAETAKVAIKKIKQQKSKPEPDIQWPVTVTHGPLKNGRLQGRIFKNRQEADAAGYDWVGRPQIEY